MDKISYRNSKGNAFENYVQEIFVHFINHSTYHRAQIAVLMKQLGVEAIITFSTKGCYSFAI